MKTTNYDVLLNKEHEQVVLPLCVSLPFATLAKLLQLVVLKKCSWDRRVDAGAQQHDDGD